MLVSDQYALASAQYQLKKLLAPLKFLTLKKHLKNIFHGFAIYISQTHARIWLSCRLNLIQIHWLVRKFWLLDFCYVCIFQIFRICFRVLQVFQHLNSTMFIEKWKSTICFEFFRDQKIFFEHLQKSWLLICRKSTWSNWKTMVSGSFSWIHTHCRFR